MLYHKLHWGSQGGPEFLLVGGVPPLAPPIWTAPGPKTHFFIESTINILWIFRIAALYKCDFYYYYYWMNALRQLNYRRRTTARLLIGEIMQSYAVIVLPQTLIDRIWLCMRLTRHCLVDNTLLLICVPQTTFVFFVKRDICERNYSVCLSLLCFKTDAVSATVDE